MSNRLVELTLEDTEDFTYNESFLLLNPQEEKIEFLKNKLKYRYDETSKFYDEDFNAVDFVRSNFEFANVERINIKW